MNKCWPLVVVAVALHTGLSCASETVEVKVPGTGVSMSLPSSMQHGPLGTYYVEPSGQTIVQILVGTKEHEAEKAPLFGRMYPTGPRQIDLGTTQARLYKRTRAENGGGWDGWSYNLSGRESALNVSVMYTGSDADWFDGFEQILETVRWDEQQLDSERSFRAHIAVPGLQLVQRQVGGLWFTADGSPGTGVPSLGVQAMPVTAAQAGQIFPAICETGIAQAFEQGKYSGPHRFESAGIAGCDGWASVEDEKMVYVAILRTADGAVLSAIANLAPKNFDATRDSFRGALLQMKRLH
jgi:hypothetical protein